MANLHSFDRKLDTSFENFIYPVSPTFSQEVKVEVEDLPSRLHLSSEACKILQILIGDIGKSPNQDGINRLSVDDLLLKLNQVISQFDHAILDTQLLEMRSGMCPQGRTIRLLQVLKSAYH